VYWKNVLVLPCLNSINNFKRLRIGILEAQSIFSQPVAN
jgi:hypothetical protein